METKKQLREELREAKAEVRDGMTEIIELAAQERERHGEVINLRKQIEKLKAQPDKIQISTATGMNVHYGDDIRFQDGRLYIYSGDDRVAVYCQNSYDKVFFNDNVPEKS